LDITPHGVAEHGRIKRHAARITRVPGAPQMHLRHFPVRDFSEIHARHNHARTILHGGACRFLSGTRGGGPREHIHHLDASLFKMQPKLKAGDTLAVRGVQQHGNAPKTVVFLDWPTETERGGLGRATRHNEQKKRKESEPCVRGQRQSLGHCCILHCS
jgi:hypothetical protein